MRGRGSVGFAIKMRYELSRGKPVKIGQKLDHLLLARMAMHRSRHVHLHAIARGKQHRLGLGKLFAQLPQRIGRLLLVKYESLADRKRCGGVIQADHKKTVHQPLPPVGMNWTATSVPKTRTKPKMLRMAARRPRKRGLIGACITIA